MSIHSQTEFLENSVYAFWSVERLQIPMERTQGSDFFAHMKKHDIISVFYAWVTPSESCLKLVVTRIKYQHEDIESRICGKTPWF